MTTRVLFSSVDGVYSDDFIIKEGSIPQKFLDRIESEYPETFWDWDDEGGYMTLENEEWTIHYNSPFPLCFYYGQEFAFGIRKPRSEIQLDLESPEAVWVRVKTLPEARLDYTQEDDEIYEEGTGRVVMERGDFPRFQTLGKVLLSHTLTSTQYDNVYSLGNGYVLASSREVEFLGDGVRTSQECWWMLAPESRAHEASGRVLAVKLYDGPHKFQSRSTDIKLADPIPPTEISEYVIYSYDRTGLKGLYREIFQGVAPQKKAFVVQGDELLGYAENSDLRYRQDQLVGPGTVRYKFPIYSTKLLNVFWRGSEVRAKIRADEGQWVNVEDYDGKAITTLEIELEVFTSMSSLRVEYEALKDWVPVGRPRVDIVPNALEGVAGNAVKITGTEGEGLRQSVELYTGMWSAAATVNCFYGEAVLDVGGLELVTWNLNKRDRFWGDFVSNNDEYEITLTGNGNFSYEIDQPSITESGNTAWQGDEMQWYIETEDEKHDASESINNPETPVSLDEEKLWRIGVHLPSNVEKKEITVSSIFATTYSTGETQVTRNIFWDGEEPGRVYYPDNVISAPVVDRYISVEGKGATVWQQHNKRSLGDLEVSIDGSPLSFKNEFIYRPVTIKNEMWRVEIDETLARVYFQDEPVGEMYGQGLPFRLAQLNTEDAQLDCSVGFVQLRRGMGPRFQGWELGENGMPVSEKRAVYAWGATEDEAEDNTAFYRIRIE